MAYAFVQKGFGEFGTNTLTWTGATTAGNLLVIAFIKGLNASEFVSSIAGNVNTIQSWATAVGSLNNINCKIVTGSGNATNFGSATLVYLPGSANLGGDTTHTFTLSGDQGGNMFIAGMEFSGIASTSPFINYNFGAQTNPGTGADAITSGGVTVGTVPALLAGFGYFLNEPAGTLTGTGFSGRSIDPTNRFMWGEDQRITSASSPAATFTESSGGATDTTLAFGMAFAEPAVPQLADGTTASGTVVSTGTGGAALPAFNIGDCIHVLLMAQTASALTETGPSDGHNTYVHLETADNHGTHGFIWDRWMTIVTTAITTPVITTTWSGTAKLAIAAGKLSNINTGAPNVVGGNAQQFQTAPSGGNSQSSGPTTSPNLLVPVTLSAWGFSINETAAPAAGTGFTAQGTCWAALGGACLTWATGTSTQAIQQTALFTPVAGNTYTFMDVFNQIGSAPPTVTPSGPMPRQIYVMP